MNRRKTFSLLTTCLVGAAMAWPITSAHAALSPIGAGETIAFSDDFADNSNSWSNIGPATAQATIGIDPGATSESVWHPSNADLTNVKSALTLGTALDISAGDIFIYMRVRVDKVNGVDGSRFRIDLTEQSPSNRLGALTVRPGSNAVISRRNSGGGGVGTNIAAFTYPDTSTFVDFRLQFTDNNDGSATLEAFRYDTGTTAYVSMGSVADADLESGLFDQLKIENRNGTDGAAYFDSVVVTQIIPEPASLGLMGLGAVLMLGRGKKAS